MTDPARKATRLLPARVDFDGHRPVSVDFDDVYYDADGPAEVERVFVAPARIPERSKETDILTVGELGFGTGLNFIVTASKIRSRLHYISFERHPLAQADVARALTPWKAAYEFGSTLIDAYPPPVPGWHRRIFDAGRVRLSVFFGDVAEGMADLVRQQQRGVDAWFLDGFAPRKNPEMWEGALFRAMAGLSATAASVTTFSAAGQVRRNLAAAGFETRRVDQRPHKRHTTVATFTGAGRSFTSPPQVTVLGAGLAGAATARALAERGIRAIVHDRVGIAAGASSIPAAVLHPRLSPHASAESRLRAHAYLFAANRCRHWLGTGASGALQRPRAGTDVERLRGIADAVPDEVAALVDAARASELAGIELPTPALFYPGALTVDGAALTADLATHADIELTTYANADGPVVRATGNAIDGFEWLEVTGLAGQMDRFPCPGPPRLPLVGDSTIVPARESVWAGATYEYRPWNPERATAANSQRFEDVLRQTPGRALERFRGVRAVTSDHLPVVGCAASDWFNLGHGSHGTSTAILGAEIIASIIDGEVGPVTSELLALLRPSRFKERQERRPNPFLATRGG
ncbi:MAG: tRNA (5-methylaminomethyl-2-thiouridine)(34)-methyltransferase MnmD [Gammaproteobacteria bacterium]|nr:tRNA (5-methylaminomethyl-2-thiouridine)(34)-methyltransferase MnmD [Gammaproteobacteria bacterium]